MVVMCSFLDILLLTFRVIHTRKWSLTDKSYTKLSDIVLGAVVYTWSIKAVVVCVASRFRN